MPKTTRMSPEEKELAEAIRRQFDGAFVLTACQVGQVVGLRSKQAVRAWLSTLVPKERNGKPVWLVSDVAQKINS